MTENRKYETPKGREERIVEAMESIAGTLKILTEHIISDPGDEVDPIIRNFKLPDDINDIP